MLEPMDSVERCLPILPSLWVFHPLELFWCLEFFSTSSAALALSANVGWPYIWPFFKKNTHGTWGWDDGLRDLGETGVVCKLICLLKSRESKGRSTDFPKSYEHSVWNGTLPAGVGLRGGDEDTKMWYAGNGMCEARDQERTFCAKS